MAQEITSSTPITPEYITPISCPHCAANAHLVHRVATVGKGETRTFECSDCKALTEMIVTN